MLSEEEGWGRVGRRSYGDEWGDGKRNHKSTLFKKAIMVSHALHAALKNKKYK